MPASGGAGPPAARKRESTLRFQLRAFTRAAIVFALFVAYLTQPLFCTRRGPRKVDADPSRLRREVELLSTSLVPRDASNPEKLEEVATHLHHEFASSRGRVLDQPFEADGRSWRNVIASFGPEHAERIVVGAHYDTAGPLPGADDNASGVAGLLELARLLGNVELATRVDLVAYVLEEPPWFRTPSMGSAVHARKLKEEGAAVRAMICLEMIGYFSDASGSQKFPAPLIGLFYPSTGNFVAVVGNVGGALLVRRVKSAMAEATDLPVRSLNAPSFCLGVDLSDHRNYWNEGFPAVMVTDTAFCRNVRYHTSGDTADRLDYVSMAKVVQGVFAAVVDLAR